MKVSRFFVKANYIKPAKDDWVPCEVRLLTDDAESFLCIKSVNPLAVPCPDDGRDDTRSTISEFSTTPTIASNSNASTLTTPTTPPFTALCNLAEYKSCDIRTTMVNGKASFALKLVPGGLFTQKKLLLATNNEAELTTWLSLLKTYVGKRGKGSMSSSVVSTSSPPASPKAAATAGCHLDPLTNARAHTFDSGLDEELMDNDVYEPYSTHEYSRATVEDTPDARRLNLVGQYFLRLTADQLELLEFTSRTVLHRFPYVYIRRFGAKEGSLRLEAGRRCSTGDGLFAFRVNQSDVLATRIHQLAREAKQRAAAAVTEGVAADAGACKPVRESAPPLSPAAAVASKTQEMTSADVEGMYRAVPCKTKIPRPGDYDNLRMPPPPGDRGSQCRSPSSTAGGAGASGDREMSRQQRINELQDDQDLPPPPPPPPAPKPAPDVIRRKNKLGPAEGHCGTMPPPAGNSTQMYEREDEELRCLRELEQVLEDLGLENSMPPCPPSAAAAAAGDHGAGSTPTFA